MGRKTDMPYHAFLFQFLYIADDPGLLYASQIRRLINTMYKSKINIIGLQCFHLPVNRTLDGIRICCPPISSCFIVRPKMNLKIYLIPPALYRMPIDRKRLCFRRCHIKKVNAVLNGCIHDFLNFLFA